MLSTNQQQHLLRLLQQLRAAAPAVSAPPPPVPLTSVPTHQNPMEELLLKDPLCRAIQLAVMNLPAEESQAYRLALAKCPDLILKESHPAWFLKFSSGNTQVVAEKLCAIWKMRLEFFGADRAFLPLTLDGTGALKPEDISMIKSGYMAVLPDDSQGRMVYFGDATRGAGTYSRAALGSTFKFQFWLLTLAAQRRVPYVVVRFAGDDPKFDKKKANAAGRLLNLFPVQLGAWINVYLLPKSSPARRMFQTTVVPLVKQAFQASAKISSVLTSLVHDDCQDLLRDLEALGLRRQNLPVTVGGGWTYERDFDQWMRAQQGVLEDAATVDASGAARRRSGIASVSSSRTKSSEAESAVSAREQRQARKRKMDVMYARKRRKREKDMEAKWQSQFSDLLLANSALKAKQVSLEKLLKEAKAMVAQIEHNKVTFPDVVTACEVGKSSSSLLPPPPIMPLVAGSPAAPPYLSNPNAPKYALLLQRAAESTSRGDEMPAVRAILTDASAAVWRSLLS